MKRILLSSCVLLALPAAATAAEQIRHVRVEHAPELAQAQLAPVQEGMVVYTDPDTGELRATPPAGMRAAGFPELRSDTSRIAEERRADGTIVTWLNGAGIEAQILTVDENGQARVTCSSTLESALLPDLRRVASRQGEEGVRHDR